MRGREPLEPLLAALAGHVRVQHHHRLPDALIEPADVAALALLKVGIEVVVYRFGLTPTDPHRAPGSGRRFGSMKGRASTGDAFDLAPAPRRPTRNKGAR